MKYFSINNLQTLMITYHFHIKTSIETSAVQEEKKRPLYVNSLVNKEADLQTKASEFH